MKKTAYLDDVECKPSERELYARATASQVGRILRAAGFAGWMSPNRRPPGEPGFRLRETPGGELHLTYETLAADEPPFAAILERYGKSLHAAGIVFERVCGADALAILGWAD